MGGFKDMVAADRKGVFLNLDFFGDTLCVEGKEIVAVIDSEELKNRQGGQELAVADSATLFYARKEDLPARRAPGSNLNVNGRECIIDAWQENAGIATVVLRESISA
ncbi:MAG: sugar ABC transporter ATP-binding protein [Clostridiales bacterium]|nr:sugar ABC transporter ATP-binding protein [Clostridiales bacterium]